MLNFIPRNQIKYLSTKNFGASILNRNDATTQRSEMKIRIRKDYNWKICLWSSKSRESSLVFCIYVVICSFYEVKLVGREESGYCIRELVFWNTYFEVLSIFRRGFRNGAGITYMYHSGNVVVVQCNFPNDTRRYAFSLKAREYGLDDLKGRTIHLYPQIE